MNDMWKTSKYLLVGTLEQIRKDAHNDVTWLHLRAFHQHLGLKIVNLTDYQKWIFNQLVPLAGLPKYKWDYGFVFENNIPEGRLWVWSFTTRGPRANDRMPLNVLWDKAQDLGLYGMRLPGINCGDIYYRTMFKKEEIEEIPEHLVKHVAIYCPIKE